VSRRGQFEQHKAAAKVAASSLASNDLRGGFGSN
jgi:hypothetical protein